jgi:hypothetical protein
VVGLFTYRVISLWLPVPFGLARVLQLHDMGERPVDKAQGTAEAPKEPALRHRGD